MTPTVYMLIGPKGSGKTYIGTLVGRETDIHFIRVESIWLQLQPGENGWLAVEQHIDAAIQTHPKIMIESLGAGEGFRGLYTSLRQKYTVKLIRVYADLDTCLVRVQTRDSKDHIAVSDEKVVEYNRIAAQVTYPWDAEINNEQPASDAAILAAIQQI